MEQHLEEEIIQVVVPKGGAEGDMIQVKVEKETFYVTVPQGVEVGDTNTCWLAVLLPPSDVYP